MAQITPLSLTQVATLCTASNTVKKAQSLPQINQTKLADR